MKSKINIFLFAMLISCSFFANAQEEPFNYSVNASGQIAKEMIDNNRSIGIDNAESTSQFLQNNNLIQITQIGNYNYSTINVQSNSVAMAINQFGSNNYIDVYKSAYELNESITQTGNNNYISDFSLNSYSPSNMSLNQEGNNLTIFNNGSNSISKDMKITQTGGSGTIFIFNH